MPVLILFRIAFLMIIVNASLPTPNRILGDIYRGSKLGDTYLRFYPRSIIGCARECNRRKRCRAINYYRGFRYCELSFTDRQQRNVIETTETTNFLRSDIYNWSKVIAGKCAHHNCSFTETCDEETGNCSVKDCGQLNIEVDRNSQIHIGGHNEVGNGVQYRCLPSYTMHNETGEVESNVYHVLCKEDGHWEKANFFCKRASTMLEDFCPSDYKYSQKNKICYKEHFISSMTRDEAQKTCAAEKAHLLSTSDNETLRAISGTLKDTAPKQSEPYSSKYYCSTSASIVNDRFLGSPNIVNATVMIDGISKDNVWLNWAGEELPFLTTNTARTEANSTCLGIGSNRSIFEVPCTSTSGFLCHFELCPISAGYILHKNDVCYKLMPPSDLHHALCMGSAYFEKLKDMYQSEILDVQKNQDNEWDPLEHVQLYGHIFQNIKEKAFLYVNDSAWGEAAKKCRENGLKLADIINNGTYQNVASVLGHWTHAVAIGVRLNISSYKYEPVKGMGIQHVYRKNNIEVYTDRHRCVTVDIAPKGLDCVNRLIDCSTELRYICVDKQQQDMEDLTLELNQSTYDNALRDCNSRNKTLLHLVTEEDFDELCKYLLSNRSGSVDRIYLGHYLAAKKYTYESIISRKNIPEDDLNFRRNYSNNEKDSHRYILYYPETKEYGLTTNNAENHYLCQTVRSALWYRHVDTDDNTARVKVRASLQSVSYVSEENVLSYVCSVDTTRIIASMVLPRT